LTEEQEIQILSYVEENTIYPSRIIANEFGISKSSVLKTFKKYKYKPYKSPTAFSS
jgi:DNA-binding Lrp family transcriptional regulator